MRLISVRHLSIPADRETRTRAPGWSRLAAVLCLAGALVGCASVTAADRTSPVSTDPLDAAVDPTPIEESPTVPSTSTAVQSPPSDTPEAEVLGISIHTSAIGQISIAPSRAKAGVELSVLQAQVGLEDTNASIALAQYGEIVASTRVIPGQDVDLSVVEPGIYEVWAIGTGPDVTTDNGVTLAGAQTIERIGDINIE